MEYILRAAGKSIKGITSPGLIRIFIYSFLATVAALILLLYGIYKILAMTVFSDTAWMESSFDIGGTIIGFILAWLLFPVMLPIIVSFFDEKIADLVEEADYPGLPKPEYPFWPTFWQDVRFTLKAIGLNILILPLYLLPIVNIAIYFLLNGYLLGQQFFRMAAIRRIGIPAAEAMIKEHGRKIWMAGALVAFLATVPILNLISPFWGVALMLHLFHQLWERENIIEVPYVEVDRV